MTDAASRTIIISVVWLAVAIALGIGLPLARVPDPSANVAIVFFVMCAATLVTLVIWLTKRSRPESRGFEVFQPAPVLDGPESVQ